MSDRVVLARRRPDAQFALFRSQWADTNRLVWAATTGHCVVTASQDGPAWRQCGRKRWRKLVDELSYLTLDLCLRCVGSTTTAYLPVWAGIPARGREQTPANCGTLVRVNSVVEYERLRRQLRQHKAQLGVAIERGTVDMERAQKQLLEVCHPRERHLSAGARRLLGTSGE